MTERIYTEEEVAAIFARAAERQRSRSTRDASAGLTLVEIEQVGLEAGLASAAIRAAANDLDVRQQFPISPKTTVAERWIENSIPTGAWEELVAYLRHQFGTNHAWWVKDTASLGEAQEWRHTAASGVETTVTLSPRDEGTRLRVMQEDVGLEDARRMGWLMAAFLAAIPSVLAGALVAETFVLGDLAGVAAMVLVLLVGTALGGPWLAARVRTGRARQAEQVQHIADELVEQLGGDQSEPVAPTSSEISVPRFDLSTLDAPVSGVEVPPEKRRGRA